MDLEHEFEQENLKTTAQKLNGSAILCMSLYNKPGTAQVGVISKAQK